MIPDEVLKFSEQLVWGRAGTRDAQLVPALHNMVVGYCPDRERATVLVPGFAAMKLEENLADNGWIALSLNASSHQAYQLKGHVQEVRDATEDERTRAMLFSKQASQYLATMGLPEPISSKLDRMALDGLRAVTFRVEEVYDQTPGPGAGKRLL